MRAELIQHIAILEGQNSVLSYVAELKLLDANIIAKEVFYARQRAFEFHNKPGERLAYVLTDDYVIAHEGWDRAFIINPQKKISLFVDYYFALYMSDTAEDQAIIKFIRAFCITKVKLRPSILVRCPNYGFGNYRCCWAMED